MSVFGLSIVLALVGVAWFLFAYVVGIEAARGERLFLRGARSVSDSVVIHVRTLLGTAIDYLDRHVIRLSWYYSLHSFLAAALRVVVSIYDYLESWFHHNRTRARALRAERRGVKRKASAADTPATLSHLTSMVAHKQETALTEKQKQKLKTKKLERG